MALRRRRRDHLTGALVNEREKEREREDDERQRGRIKNKTSTRKKRHLIPTSLARAGPGSNSSSMDLRQRQRNRLIKKSINKKINGAHALNYRFPLFCDGCPGGGATRWAVRCRRSPVVLHVPARRLPDSPARPRTGSDQLTTAGDAMVTDASHAGSGRAGGKCSARRHRGTGLARGHSIWCCMFYLGAGLAGAGAGWGGCTIP